MKRLNDLENQIDILAHEVDEFFVDQRMEIEDFKKDVKNSSIGVLPLDMAEEVPETNFKQLFQVLESLGRDNQELITVKNTILRYYVCLTTLEFKKNFRNKEN